MSTISSINASRSRILMLYVTSMFANILCGKGKNVQYIIVGIQERKVSHLLCCRGEWIVPNFEEIWPSGKPRRRDRKPGIPTKGIGYIEHAMQAGIPGERDKDFTTVGKPRVGLLY